MKQRLHFAAEMAFRHFGVSLLVAGLAAWLVFHIWYPAPMAQLFKVSHIYWIFLLADAVSGPLLTLVLANPRKSGREMALDFSLIGLIQLGALGYGLYTLEAGRPVAVVFESDRLVAVGKNEIFEENCDKSAVTDACAFPLWTPPRPLMLASLSGEQLMESLELSLQGVSPARRPAQWIEWAWDNEKLQSRLQPLTALGADAQQKVHRNNGSIYLNDAGLRYLPLVSAKEMEWIAVFDASGRWLDSIAVDGFSTPSDTPPAKAGVPH